MKQKDLKFSTWFLKNLSHFKESFIGYSEIWMSILRIPQQTLLKQIWKSNNKNDLWREFFLLFGNQPDHELNCVRKSAYDIFWPLWHKHVDISINETDIYIANDLEIANLNAFINKNYNTTLNTTS